MWRTSVPQNGTVRLVPFDLSWAAHGYLSCPSGRLRFIRGLDVIVDEARRLGAHIYWYPDCQRLGACDIESRMVLLSPRLERAVPVACRRVLTYELLHLECGRDDALVRSEQAARFGELVAA